MVDLGEPENMDMNNLTVAMSPCLACPYRKDVPSGVWEIEEYDKLIAYDRPTERQPTAVFACHARPDQLCNGWYVCHSSRGSAHELLATRLHPVQNHNDVFYDRIKNRRVPLFLSGSQAARHGMTDVFNPGYKARQMIATLRSRYPRLSEGMEEEE